MDIINKRSTSALLVPFLLIAVCALNACKKEDNNEPESEAVIRPISAQSSAFVSQLIDYTPAPGQGINTANGNMDAARAILGGKQRTVSLGAFGGSITLGFDHTVLNTNGDDLIIYGNAFLNFAEPGVVWVMQDTNNNGLADDTWYELAGSAQGQTGFIRNYSVTYTRPSTIRSDVNWTDSQGKSGVIKVNAYNKQDSYYPTWITANTYTVTGTMLPTSNVNNTNPANISSKAFDFGYADNTQGGDKLDLANAIDAQGKKVTLKGADFIKIQTGIQFDLGALGELSTEVAGVADVSLIK
jgi:hypothetical protein